MRIVFDLDGTLADGSHREHFIKGEKKDWDAFFEACHGDAPIVPAIATFQALRDKQVGDTHKLEIWSGRGEGKNSSVRIKTLEWLRHWVGFGFCDLQPTTWFAGTMGKGIGVRMRRHGDYTPDDKLKLGWLNAAREQGHPPDLVFDDRQRVVDMWRAEGVPCFQVAKGDF